MAARAPTPVFDLLAWPAIEAARAERNAAELARNEALDRWRYAPRGKSLERLRALQEATQRLLKAGEAVARAEAEAVH